MAIGCMDGLIDGWIDGWMNKEVGIIILLLNIRIYSLAKTLENNSQKNLQNLTL